MHSDPTDIVTHYLTLTCVEAGADLEPKSANFLRYRTGAADRAGRTVECRKKAVSRCIDFAAAKPDEFATDQGVVAIE